MNNLHEHQYKDSSKFNARIYLHYKFSTNKHRWPLWVFDNLRNEKNLRILELGCGNGYLWKSNAGRIPAGWNITLSDFSEGMLQDAKNHIGAAVAGITYEVINAEQIPYENCMFDIIIANHMLYHVPDKSRALSEIYRVLKNDGVLYATTMHSTYMKELGELFKEFRPGLTGQKNNNAVISSFSIENGGDQLKKYFDEIELRIYDNSLVIDEAEPFINYVYSLRGMHEKKNILEENEKERELFAGFIVEKIERNGAIVVPSDAGLFICRKKVHGEQQA